MCQVGRSTYTLTHLLIVSSLFQCDQSFQLVSVDVDRILQVNYVCTLFVNI